MQSTVVAAIFQDQMAVCAPLVATPTDGSSSVSGAAHGSCGEDLKQHPGRVGRPLLATSGPPLAKCIVRRCTLAQLVADDNGKCISA